MKVTNVVPVAIYDKETGALLATGKVEYLSNVHVLDNKVVYTVTITAQEDLDDGVPNHVWNQHCDEGCCL